MDDALCTGQPIPFVDYTPATTGLTYTHDRPISVSGWCVRPGVIKFDF